MLQITLYVKGDDKYTRSIECVVFMITNGRIPTIDEMTTDEYGLLSMSDIDLVDLRMSSRQWELHGLISRLGRWAGGGDCHLRRCDYQIEHQPSHSGGVFERDMRPM